MCSDASCPQIERAAEWECLLPLYNPHWKPIHVPLIPDTLEGAIMLSVIDFFLSFFMIAGIGLVLTAFPALSRLAKRTAKDVLED